MTRQLKLPVPVHIITGGLGSGKTTFIQALLKQKPTDARWALVINEFGAVGIDQALLQASANESDGSIAVKELAGGCMCCVLSEVTSVSIAQLIRAVKPDRLWIEPSGLGHPATLVDVLRGEHLASALDLQPIVCLVDCVQFRPARLPWGAQPAFLANELCRSQLSIADIVVGSKTDLAGSDAVKGFLRWAGQLYPPKQQVLTAANGLIKLDDPGVAVDPLSLGFGKLSLSPSSSGQQPAQQAGAVAAASSGQGSGNSPAADAAAVQTPQGMATTTPPSRVMGSSSHKGGLVWLTNAPQPEGPVPGRPQRKEARHEQLNMAACGWLFHPDDTFSQKRLQLFLDELQALVPRIKGVFRVSRKAWVCASAGTAAGASSSDSGAVQLQEIAYRRDSRLELIVPLPEAAVASGPESAVRNDVGAKREASNGQQQEQEEQQQDLSGPSGPEEGSEVQQGAALGGSSAVELAAAIEKGRLQGDWSQLDAMVLALLQQP